MQEQEKKKEDLEITSSESVSEPTQELKELQKEPLESKEDSLEIEEKENNTTQTPKTPAKKQDELEEKLENIKQEIESIYQEYQNTLQEFEQLSAALASQENAIISTTINTTQELLKELYADGNEDFANTIAKIELDNKKEILEVKKPSKGRFKGVFLGTAATLLTVAGLGAYGAKLANLPINLATFSQKSNIDTIVSKYLELMKLGHMQPSNGYIILAAGSILVGFIVYKIITFTQKLKNKKYVEHLETNAKEYKEELLSQISELQKVIEQIPQIQELNEKYDILLQEQNAKLKRILFFEKPNNYEELHTLSKAEIEKTQLLLKELLTLMNTPLLKANSLNEDALTNFQSAQTTLEELLKKLY